MLWQRNTALILNLCEDKVEENEERETFAGDMQGDK